MKTIGILGGGQLGQMLGLAAIPLGIKCIFYEQAVDPCAASAGKVHKNLNKFIEEADVFTYEFENIPPNITDTPGIKGKLFPPLKPLKIAANRCLEKALFRKLGIPIVEWLPLTANKPLKSGDAKINLDADALYQTMSSPDSPLIIKTTTMGYDGKGQIIVRSHKDLPKATRTLNKMLPSMQTNASPIDSGSSSIAAAPFIAEQMVKFSRELSIISARDRKGNIAHYPITENHHENGILYSSYAPASITPAHQRQLQEWMEKLLKHLSYVGILTLEVFDTSAGLLANEMAPRVHNSGHWTLEGSQTSQFENHIRAVAGLPLGSTAARGYSKMFNLVGRTEPRLTRISDAHLHLYSKQPRKGRKLGHITYTADSQNQLKRKIAHMTRHKSFYS